MQGMRKLILCSLTFVHETDFNVRWGCYADMEAEHIVVNIGYIYVC